MKEWDDSAEGKKISTEYVIDLTSETTTFFAHWAPKTYLVEFDAGERTGDGGDAANKLTKTNNTPAGEAPQKMHAIVKYDAALSTMQYVTANGEGWTAEGGSAGNLPYAWEEGRVFCGWTFGNAQVTADTVFNVSSLPGLEAEKFASESDGKWTAPPGAVFTPDYKAVKITYNANGGTFTGGQATLTEEHIFHAPLKAFVAKNGITENIGLEGICGSDNTTYAVISTKAEYFKANNNTYAPNDYRYTLSRKGYTFGGWYETKEGADAVSWNAVGQNSVAALDHYELEQEKTLYAAWLPNTYNVDLTVPRSQYSDFTPETGDFERVTVTVGEPVEGEDWPDRKDWYAYNKDGDNLEASRRYLLGFTFEELDPGSTSDSDPAGLETYRKYSQDITNIANVGCLFQKASSVSIEGETISTAATKFKIPGMEYVAKVELMYRNGAHDEYHIPFYRFFVELPELTEDNGMKTYGAYYVPAVHESYISNMPVWDGSFN